MIMTNRADINYITEDICPTTSNKIAMCKIMNEKLDFFTVVVDMKNKNVQQFMNCTTFESYLGKDFTKITGFDESYFVIDLSFELLKSKTNEHVRKMLPIYYKFSSIDLKEIFYKGLHFYEPAAVLNEKIPFDDEWLSFNVGEYEIWYELSSEEKQKKFSVHKYVDFDDLNSETFFMIEINAEGVEITIDFDSLTIPFSQCVKDSELIYDFWNDVSNMYVKTII